LSGDQSGGPADRGEDPQPDEQTTSEVRIPSDPSPPEPPPDVAGTVAGESPDPVPPAEGEPDPWPALANVGTEDTWDGAFDPPAYELAQDAPPAPGPGTAAPRGTAPRPGAAALETDRRVAPQPEERQGEQARPSVPMAAAVPPPPPPLIPAPGTPPVGVPQLMVAGPPPHLPPPRSSGRQPKILIAAGVVVAVVLAGALFVVLSAGGGSERPAVVPARTGATAPPGSAAPSSSAPPGSAPAPGGPAAPTSGPGAPSAPEPGAMTPQPTGVPAAPRQVPGGPAVRYQTVQQDPGYFEGTVTFTNQTGAPMHAWELSFTYPGANVKNIWDAVLVRGGDHPVIRSTQTADAIPPGGSLEVRFGAEGSPSAPGDCLLGGRPCSFA
jgi:hypothetical protein